jgi:tetratricopeptide (TPR) repeat protein
MATPKPTKTKGDDSIPFYDGSYYLMVTHIMDTVRRERGVANKLRGATREARAIGSHTKRRFSALGLIGKLLTAVLLVGLGAGAAVAAYVYLLRPDPASLREEVRAHLALGELVEARRDLETLRVVVGDLTPSDRAGLAGPLRARLEAQARKVRREVESNARLGRHERALAALDELDALDADARWALFTRAEILRAGKLRDASATYERFVELYPDSDQADDALFWQALIARDGGRAADARALCEALLTKHPKSDFRTASDRMLAELATAHEGARTWR